MKRTSHISKGFTLIELLVVIAIIAILTAIVTSNFAQSKAKSRDAKRISDIAQIQLALGLFFDRCNVFPSTLAENSGAATCPGVTLGTFIAKLPTNNGVSYNLTYKHNGVMGSNPTDYRLGVLLDTTSSVLTDSIKGTTYTLNCDAVRMYCVAPN